MTPFWFADSMIIIYFVFVQPHHISFNVKGYNSMFIAVFTRENYLYDFLFGSLDVLAPSKRGLLLKREFAP